MPEINLNIHGILKVRIINTSKAVFEALNSPFSYFETPEAVSPDLEIHLGDFREDAADCAVIDGGYFVKKDYIFFKGKQGPLNWKVEITGLGSDKCKARMAYGKGNRFVLPNLLYPDQLMYNHLLYPLLERYFVKKGCLFLHAGAAARGGKGMVFAGPGGSHKTSIIMNLVKNGFYSLGDGWIILKGNKIFSFPTSTAFFNYRTKYLGSENLSFYHKLDITRFLLKKAPQRNFIKAHATLDVLFIMHNENREDIQLERIIDKPAVIEALLTNNRLEWKADLFYKQDASAFFDAYNYVHGNARDYEDAFRAAASETLEGIRLYIMRAPTRWHKENLGPIENIINSG